jgi:hypothetical protein
MFHTMYITPSPSNPHSPIPFPLPFMSYCKLQNDDSKMKKNTTIINSFSLSLFCVHFRYVPSVDEKSIIKFHINWLYEKQQQQQNYFPLLKCCTRARKKKKNSIYYDPLYQSLCGGRQVTTIYGLSISAYKLHCFIESRTLSGLPRRRWWWWWCVDMQFFKLSF